MSNKYYDSYDLKLKREIKALKEKVEYLKESRDALLGASRNPEDIRKIEILQKRNDTQAERIAHYQRIVDAVEWVLTDMADMAYKAPEQVNVELARVWYSVLSEALHEEVDT